MKYEGLNNTHYNVTLRIGDEAMYSPAGDIAKLKETEKSFAENAKKGTSG